MKCEMQAPEQWKEHQAAIGKCASCGRAICSSHSAEVGGKLYCWEMQGFSEAGCAVDAKWNRRIEAEYK